MKRLWRECASTLSTADGDFGSAQCFYLEMISEIQIKTGWKLGQGEQLFTKVQESDEDSPTVNWSIDSPATICWDEEEAWKLNVLAENGSDYSTMSIFWDLLMGLEKSVAFEWSLHQTLSYASPKLIFSGASRDDLILRVWQAYLAGLGEKYIKYLLCLHSAKSFSQEEVPKPFRSDLDSSLYHGLTGRRIRRNNGGMSSLKRGMAILAAKRATAKVSDEFQEQTFHDHADRLSADPKPLPEWFEAVAERVISAVVRPYKPSPNHLAPSPNGQFHVRRKDLGAYSILRCPEVQFWGDRFTQDVIVKKSVAFQLCFDDLVRMYERSGVVVELRVRGYGLVFENLEIALISTPFEPIEAQPSAVCEPLKVRTITKGARKKYFSGRYLQKWLWKCLSNLDMFRLTHRPLYADDLNQMYCRIRRLTDGTGLRWKLLSGDYSAATDYLSSEVSDCLWEIIARKGRLTDFETFLGHQLLTRHRLQYPAYLNIPPRMQKNGQLMGSPISFPILCMANAVANVYYLETYLGRFLTWDEIPLLINGDDVGTVIFDNTYDHWCSITESIGLIRSPGKNYVHDSMWMLNSRAYVLEEAEDFERTAFLPERVFRPVPFLNPGLLKGVGRVMSEDGDDLEDGASGLAQRCWELLETAGSSAEQRDDLITDFVRYNNQRLSKIAYPGMSYFVPRGLGGLGLPPRSYEVISDGARRLATYLSSLDPLLMSRMMPRFTGAVCRLSHVTLGSSRMASIEDALGFQRKVERVTAESRSWTRDDEMIESSLGFFYEGIDRVPRDSKSANESHFRKVFASAQKCAPLEEIPNVCFWQPASHIGLRSEVFPGNWVRNFQQEYWLRSHFAVGCELDLAY